MEYPNLLEQDNCNSTALAFTDIGTERNKKCFDVTPAQVCADWMGMNGSQGSQMLSVYGMVPESSTIAICATAESKTCSGSKLGRQYRNGMAYGSVLGCLSKLAEAGGPARGILVISRLLQSSHQLTPQRGVGIVSNMKGKELPLHTSGGGIVRTVILDVSPPRKALSDLIRVWKSGKGEKAARISFATPELLWKVLSARRWEILKALCAAGPVSIREVARRVERDVKAVHGDVIALIEAGLLQRTDSGGVEFPYDAIKVEFHIEAA